MRFAVGSSVLAGLASVVVSSTAAVAIAPAADGLIRAERDNVRLTAAFTESGTQVSAADSIPLPTLVQIALMVAQVAPGALADMVAHPDEAFGTLNNLVNIGEAATYGTVVNGVHIPAGVVGPNAQSFGRTAEFPGEFTELVPSIASDSEEADRAQIIAELNAAGAPEVLVTAIIQSHRMGVTGLQAQSLLRYASLDATQDFVTALAHDGDIRAAIVDGVTEVGKAVFGDRDLEGQPGGTVEDPDTGATVASTRRLGAIRTVTTGLRNATDATAASFAHDLGVSSAAGPRHLRRSGDSVSPSLKSALKSVAKSSRKGDQGATARSHLKQLASKVQSGRHRAPEHDSGD